MNLIQALENKKEILNPDKKVFCSRCNQQLFSPFDKIYITVKGQCYTCETDDNLANNILNNL